MKMYKKVNIADTDDDEVAIDASGYTGNFHRNRDESHLKPITKE
jgi:hypothetical protein